MSLSLEIRKVNHQVLDRRMLFAGGLDGGGGGGGGGSGGGGFLRHSPYTARGGLQLLILLLKPLENWEDRHIQHTQLRCWFRVDNFGNFCKHAAQAW